MDCELIRTRVSYQTKNLVNSEPLRPAMHHVILIF